MTDLDARLAFTEEIDNLKSVDRRTRLIDDPRQENTAEHSWHVATMALALAPCAPTGVDINRVIQMLLVHDIVEIDVGDTFAYDEKGHEEKPLKESKAADRIFGILPDETARHLRGLWEEYEAAQTPDGAFAHSIDRFLPILHNYRTDGYAWRIHSITRTQVLKRNAVIERGCPPLWPVLLSIVDDAVAKGMLIDA
jgi:putative hydrolase of HD superfamily